MLRKLVILTILLLACVLANVPSADVLLELTGLDEDSLYLHSPRPDILYYSGLLPETKDFVIRGTAGENVRRLTFSPGLGDAPAPLTGFRGGEWSVRYTVQSADEPATLTITAYDLNGVSAARTIAVIKDTLPPDPPAWVKIWPDQSGIDYARGLEKMDNDRQVVVTWTDGQDGESGVRYHVLGASAKWWQNAEHKSGDTEEAAEGENTFYVFAVDNVGNVSLPATDRVYIDTIAPDVPALFSAVTSADYFYGACDPDVETILVNGLRDGGMEITPNGSWRHKHGLNGDKRLAVRLQALDKLQNKSPVGEFVLEVDRTPPRIFYAEHNAAEKVLRVRDRVTVTAKSEENCAAFFRIDGVTAGISMYDDGTRGDARARDGIYTGGHAIVSDEDQGALEVFVTVYDRAGNESEQKTLQPLNMDSWAELPLDDFENIGDAYPWKNHLKAANVRYVDGIDEQAAEGGGCLRVEYDLDGRQNWAGLSSREFLPRNYYGRRPALQFWLKGSGSASARLIIRLLPKGARNTGLDAYHNDFTYSVPLEGAEWKKYSVLLPEKQLDGLEQTVRYAVYVYSPDKNDRGVFYLDDLRVVYRRPLNADTGVLATAKNVAPVEIPPPEPAGTALKITGDSLLAPYLSLELSPRILSRGGRQTAEVFIPPEMSVSQAYVVWGRLNQKLQTSRLEPLGGNIFNAEYQVPSDLQTGEQQGLVFVQSADGRLYKKPFYYKVFAADNAGPAERITAQFFPHPLVPGKDIRVRVAVPAAVQTSQVMLFLGQDQSKVFSVPLNKQTADGAYDIWQGSFVLPEGAAAGEYSANIFGKTAKGGFLKQKTKYSVDDYGQSRAVDL